MINVDEEYRGLLSSVLTGGTPKTDRTGTGTKSVFGRTIRHDMRAGFPLLTTKYVSFKCAKTELLWMLNGRTDLKYLVDHGVNYWEPDYERSGRTDGTLGKIYGSQWRNFNGVDQIHELIKNINDNPDSRRLIVSAWNPADMHDMALPPCHDSFQIYINDGKMDLLWRQRSVDIFLGLPYNIAMYGLLLILLSNQAGLIPGKIIGQLGDCHLYNNHLDKASIQLFREPRVMPDLILGKSIEMVEDKIILPEPKDLSITKYNHWPAIKAKLSV